MARCLCIRCLGQDPTCTLCQGTGMIEDVDPDCAAALGRVHPDLALDAFEPEEPRAAVSLRAYHHRLRRQPPPEPEPGLAERCEALERELETLTARLALVELKQARSGGRRG